MKARLEPRRVPALVVVEASDKPLAGAVTLPAALLNALQVAQAALDRAEIAVLDHIRDTGQGNLGDWTAGGWTPAHLSPPL